MGSSGKVSRVSVANQGGHDQWADVRNHQWHRQRRNNWEPLEQLFASNTCQTVGEGGHQDCHKVWWSLANKSPSVSSQNAHPDKDSKRAPSGEALTRRESAAPRST